MCLGVPGKIIELYEVNRIRMAKIDFGGVVREACVEAIPEARVGDYAIIHAGFAISLLSEQEALETLQMLHEIASLNEEVDNQPGGEQ